VSVAGTASNASSTEGARPGIKLFTA